MRIVKESNSGTHGTRYRMAAYPTRVVLAMLPLGAMIISTLTSANTNPPPEAKGMPMPPPLTVAEKATTSAYVVLGQVEQIDYMLLSGRPSELKILDYRPTDFDKREQEVLSIRVLEVLKWQTEAAVSHLKLIHTEGSTRKYFLERYSPGSRWIACVKCDKQLMNCKNRHNLRA